MKRQSAAVIGLVVSAGLCVGFTGFLISVGVRLDALSGLATPGEIYLGGGGLLAGVLGLAMFLGLVLRPAEPLRDEIPAAMHAADELPGFRAGTGLTIVAWLLRLGFLFSPPIIGAIADLSQLRYGLLLVPLAGLLVVFFAPVLATRVHHRAVDAAPAADADLSATTAP